MKKETISSITGHRIELKLDGPSLENLSVAEVARLWIAYAKILQPLVRSATEDASQRCAVRQQMAT